MLGSLSVPFCSFFVAPTPCWRPTQRRMLCKYQDTIATDPNSPSAHHSQTNANSRSLHCLPYLLKSIIRLQKVQLSRITEQINLLLNQEMQFLRIFAKGGQYKQLYKNRKTFLKSHKYIKNDPDIIPKTFQQHLAQVQVTTVQKGLPTYLVT